MDYRHVTWYDNWRNHTVFGHRGDFLNYHITSQKFRQPEIWSLVRALHSWFA